MAERDVDSYHLALDRGALLVKLEFKKSTVFVLFLSDFDGYSVGDTSGYRSSLPAVSLRFWLNCL